MVRPEHYVCQSWNVAAKVILQPYYRRSSRRERSGKESEEEEEEYNTVVSKASEAEFFTARDDRDDDSVTDHSPSLVHTLSNTLIVKDGESVSQTLLHVSTRREEQTEKFFTVAEDRENTPVPDDCSLSQTLLNHKDEETSVTQLVDPPTDESVLSDTLLVSTRDNTQLSKTLIGPEQTFNNGNKVEYKKALQKVDKFLAETEQYLRQQKQEPSTSKTVTVEINKQESINVDLTKHIYSRKRDPEKSGSKDKLPGRRERKNSCSKTELNQAESETILSPISGARLSNESSLTVKVSSEYRSKWFDKIKNRFENSETIQPLSNTILSKSISQDITYDEIDDDELSEPYLPSLKQKPCKEEGLAQCFYQDPPPPRRVEHLPGEQKTDSRQQRPVEEHIYEEIISTAQSATGLHLSTDETPPVKYRRKTKNKAPEPGGLKAIEGEKSTGGEARKRASLISSLVSCLPWQMARRYYWRQDTRSDTVFREQVKRNSRITARSYRHSLELKTL